MTPLATTGNVACVGGGTYQVDQYDCCLGAFHTRTDVFEATCNGAGCCITMPNVCNVGFNVVVDSTYVEMNALFAPDSDADPNTFSNGLIFDPVANTLCANPASSLVSGVYEYRYTYTNNNHAWSRSGYLATIWVRDGGPAWHEAGPLTHT